MLFELWRIIHVYSSIIAIYVKNFKILDALEDVR